MVPRKRGRDTASKVLTTQSPSASMTAPSGVTPAAFRPRRPLRAGRATGSLPRRRSVARSSWAIGAATAYLTWRGWRALEATSGGARRVITAEGMVLIGPAVLLLIVVVLAAERRWPAVRRPLTARGHRQDAVYLAVYVLVAVPVVTLLSSGFAVTGLRMAPWLVQHPFSPAPRWALIVLAVVLADACNWVAHFLNHRITTFWRYHALHHSQEEMSILTAFRAHPLVHASFQIAALPLLLLGIAGEIPVPVLVGYVVLSTLPHANVPWGFGPLRYVVVSPSYHRLHHDESDARGVNLGTVLVVWDMLAGLAVFPEKGAAPVATGLRGRPIPVEQSDDARGWLSVLGRQLVEPLWKPSPSGDSLTSGANSG
jgi:sterol desaturase/sphingolipid hydroxylase (fatty acid hydroxylase superfamily)